MSELTTCQISLLHQFRTNVSDVIKAHHDDKFLLRWLRARYWNLEGAEKMLRTHFQWRFNLGLDSEKMKFSTSPENIAAVLPYLPMGTSGYTKDGIPVVFINLGQIDIYGIMQSVSLEDITKVAAMFFESYMKKAAENGHYQIVSIVDLDNFSIKPYISKPIAEYFLALVQMWEENYPESLKASYIINVPRVFSILFSMIKTFLHENTISKFKLFKNDPVKWQKAIFKIIDKNYIPKYYGGNLTDPDGNPRCLTIINPGGKIPTSFYKNSVHKNFASSYSKITINKRNKFKLDFYITENGSVLKWNFYLEENDIKFSITSNTELESKKIVIPQKRVGAQQEIECGYIECEAPATYTVTFDNSYSLFTSKKLLYEIVIAPPITE